MHKNFLYSLILYMRFSLTTSLIDNTPAEIHIACPSTNMCHAFLSHMMKSLMLFKSLIRAYIAGASWNHLVVAVLTSTRDVR